MAERPEAETAPPDSEPDGVHVPLDPAAQAELGHLEYALADVRLMLEQRLISQQGHDFLTERYETRRAALATPVTPGPVLTTAAPLPETAPAATAEPAPAVSPEPVGGAVRAAADTPRAAAPAATSPPMVDAATAPATARPARRSIDAPVLLLWLGAFMVTVASLIFVGYSWTFFSGPIKTLVMAALTGAFLGAGWLCLARPSLRPAGQTFVVIGATLTPLTFVAAYNFWLRDEALGWASLGLLAALTSAGLYGRLALALGGRFYPLAALLAAEAAVVYGLEAAALPRAWWPVVAAVVGLALWAAGARPSVGWLAVFGPPAVWLSRATVAGAALGTLGAAGMALDGGRADWWPVASALAVMAAHAALAATFRQRALPASLAVTLATLAVGAGVGALGGDGGTLGLAWPALAAGAALATGVAPDYWRRALAPGAGVVALAAPWLGLTVDEPATAAHGSFVAAAALAVAVLAGLAWRWRQPGWLYGTALLATAGYGDALGWLGGLADGGRALANVPLVLAAFAGLAATGRRLGRAWAMPFYAWLVLVSLVIVALLGEQPATLAPVLVALAALAWVAVGLVGVDILLVVPLVTLAIAVGALLYAAGARWPEAMLQWVPLAWLVLGWLLWWAAPGRGAPAWWPARVARLQRWLSGLGVAASLMLALAAAVTDPGGAWWRWLAGLTLAHALSTVVAAERAQSRWGRWAGPAMIYLAALVGLRALALAPVAGMEAVTPLPASYVMGALALALAAAGLLARRAGGRGSALGSVYGLAGLAGLGLALLGNLVIALDAGAPGVAVGQSAFYLLVALALGAVAAWERRPRWLYAAVALLAVGLGFGVSAPGVPWEVRTLAFSAAGMVLTVAGLALGRSPAVSRPLVVGGLGLAGLAIPVAALTAPLAGGITMAAPALLLLAALLGLVAAVQRRVRLAEAASGVALLAILVRCGELGLDNIHWYSLPVALWLFGLAVARDRTGQAAVADGLTWAGVLTLLTPTLGMGLLDAEGWRYALLAGAEALALLAVGLRWGLRAPVAGGTLALTLMAARQVFDAARALPGWAIIGVVGLGLLTVALVLLLRREAVDQARFGLHSRWRAWR